MACNTKQFLPLATQSPKRGAGQPTSYKPAYNDQVFKLCLLGATDKEIADFFGVAESTVNNWKIRHPKFLESLKGGKLQADSDVALSLYQRAVGYSHPDVHIAVQVGKVVVTPITKHYAPDTTAAIFFLKNRAPEKWRDARKLEIAEASEAENASADDLRAELDRRGLTNPIFTWKC